MEDFNKWGGYEPNTIYNEESYQALKKMPDKCFDLVLTDPPYGIKADKGVGGFGALSEKARHYDDAGWDNKTPNIEIFNELLRVGKKVIIFGGNYFTDKLPVNSHWIVWDKVGQYNFQNPFSDCELAWTNIKKQSVRKYVFIQQGFINDDKKEIRLHPTQKPLKLIKQILNDYSKEDEIVLDCFLGSGTTAMACKELNRRYIGFEINKTYYDIALNRLNGITQQDKKLKEAGFTNIFDFMEEQQCK